MLYDELCNVLGPWLRIKKSDLTLTSPKKNPLFSAMGILLLAAAVAIVVGCVFCPPLLGVLVVAPLLYIVGLYLFAKIAQALKLAPYTPSLFERAVHEIKTGLGCETANQAAIREAFPCCLSFHSHHTTHIPANHPPAAPQPKRARRLPSS